ncbi:MAG: hypothetical protein PHV25_00815 [Candidatus Pacebacteria bacterium]|nr:hypothetical protein [Candidatus Paceibacterota bacterium]
MSKKDSPKKEIDSLIKNNSFSSCRFYSIKENKLLKNLLKSKEEMISGKGKKLESLKDLG